ncbi:DUF3376 domain-containing protein [Kitasatospora aureofaciens]|uniref:DUF3376 domain-containing protein n=1 Tax=Kitasatospora aureofaciens TaxID=1894 RepID=UPI00381A08C6
MLIGDADVPRDRQNSLITATADISRQLRRSMAVKKAVRSELCKRSKPEKQHTDQEAADLLHQVFADLDVPCVVGQLVHKAAGIYAQAVAPDLAPPRSAEDIVNDCLAIEVVTRAYAPPSVITGPLTPAFQFLRLGPDTVSPLLDQTRLKRLGDRKLYGVRYAHFGAFINREWRKSDFAWGRLDAAHHLLRLMIDDHAAREEWERKLHQAILDAEHPPSPAGAKPLDEARVWLERNAVDLEERSDRELLKEVLDTEKGQDSLRSALRSVVRLMTDSAPLAGPGGLGTSWARVLRYTRPVVARSRRSLGPHDKRWLRAVTAPVRSQIWAAYEQDPRAIPAAAQKAVRRTLAGAVLFLFLTGAAVGALVAVRVPFGLLLVGAGLGVLAALAIGAAKARRRR